MAGKKQIKVDWSEENIGTLTKMWGNGFSASQIAEHIPFATRNAVIGKAHRLGLQYNGRNDTTILRNILNNKSKNGKASKQKVKEEKVNVLENSIIPFLHRAEKRKYGLVNIKDMKAYHCHWPMWPPVNGEKKYCGCRVWKGKYCEEHYKLGHQTVQIRKLVAAE